MDGIFMHPREGLLTPYLSEAWFEAIAACIDQAKKRGIKAWIYDEFPYPSGVAGGKVVESDPGFAERHLRVQPEQVIETIQKLVTERVPKKFGLDPVNDIQVLAPMHRGVCGVSNLNRTLQNALNPHGNSIERFGHIYRIGDKVMQTRNNYELDVFNGDVGRVVQHDLIEQKLIVQMDERLVEYDFTDLDELVPAYAISIHKSQGSEYPCVIVPLLTQHFLMLQRNLLYTAVTRGKKLVVLIASKKALGIAVTNNSQSHRYGLLLHRLRKM